MISIQINGVPLPIVESDYGVRLNKKAFDLDNINRRWGDWSKSVMVASNKTSDDLFNSIFNVNTTIKNTSAENFNPDFNPNLKAPCTIFVDGIPVLEGHAQLLKISIDTQKNISYHLNCYSSFKTFFDKIEDKYLEDLDISSLNHTYSVSNITGSWSSSGYADSPGYVYPMIDYGRQDYTTWLDSEFKPAIFTKNVVDKIFSDAGYEYSSEFFNSDLFQRLIHPSEYNIKLADSVIRDRQFYVSRSTSNQTVNTVDEKTNFANYVVVDQLVFNTDTGAYYNTTGTEYSTVNGVFTPSWNGTYKFKGKLKCHLKYTGSTIPSWRFGSNDVFADLKIAVVKTSATSIALNKVVSTISINEFEFGSTDLSTNDVSLTKEIYFETQSIELTSDNSIYLVALNCTPYTKRGIGSRFNFANSNLFDFVLETTSEFGGVFTESMATMGETISMNEVLPKEVKQKDYIVSLIEMFNLYIIPDPQNNNKLIIEPRDNFFTDEKEDITEILDVSKEQEIEPMALLKATRYEWSYRDDNDIYNKQYKYMWQEDYGMYRRDVQNDFVYDTKKISILFAPTPLVNYPKNNNRSGNDRIISSIAFEDARDGKSYSKQRVRILYWGGMIQTNDTWFFVDTEELNKNFLYQFPEYTQYPYAGHLDNPYNPDIDLCFGTPRAVFYDNVIAGIDELNYIDGNLYNVYWKRWMDEITDKESRVLTCYLKLDPLSYANLSFRKLYFIGDATYRLLEVSDYDMMGGSTTKCKFLKWNPYNQHYVNRKTFNGGRDTIGDGDDPTPGFMRVLTGNKKDKYADSYVLSDGDKPYLRGFVYGDGNFGGTANASLINSNANEIRGDRVFAVNTSGRIINDGEVWINNIFSENYVEVEMNSTFIQNTFGGYIEILPSLPSNQYYKVNRVLSFYDYNGTAYPFGGEFVISTDTSYSTLATGNGAISGSADVYLNWTIGTEAIDFGEGLVITNNVEDTGAGGDLTLKIYYQIIEF